MTRKSESFLLQFVAVCCNMVMIEISIGMQLGSSVMVYHLAPDQHLISHSPLPPMNHGALTTPCVVLCCSPIFSLSLFLLQYAAVCCSV